MDDYVVKPFSPKELMMRVNAVMNRGQQLLYEYDEKIRQGAPAEILQEANRKVAEMVREESDKALAQILKNASEHMKIRYHRGDN